MKRISPSDARYLRQFEGISIFGNKQLCTARDKLGTLIDDAWHYSWHWPKDHNQFLDAVQVSLSAEIGRARDRLKELDDAQELLSAIDRHDVEAEETT